MSTPLGKFCGQLKKLSEVLLMLYPQDSYFKKAKNYLEIGVSANPRLVHTLFSDHIIKFKEEILNQDDKFFLDYCEDKEKREQVKKSSSGVLSDYKVNVNEDVVDTIMERCSQYWKQLDSNQQDTIWKYLKVLIVLAERV